MTWIKLDDQFPNHPKVLAAGPLAMLLHVCALCYCGQYLTDGFVPMGALPKLVNLDGIGEATAGVPGMIELERQPSAYDLAERLLRAGLWEDADGGYLIHDYLEYNPSRAEVEANREKWRESGRRGGLHTQAKAKGYPQGYPLASRKQSLKAEPSQALSEIQAPSPSPTPIITQSANADCVPAPTKPNPKKREPKPEAPPAVKIVHDLTGKWPASDWYAQIDRTVGRDPPALERWSNTVHAWLGLGWNKTNVKGMLEFFERNEIPGTNGRHIHDQRRNTNHGLAGLRGGNSEYRVLSKEEWDAAKQAQRDGIDLGDGPALPDLRLPQERLAEK